jgi:hypothetical protein
MILVMSLKLHKSAKLEDAGGVNEMLDFSLWRWGLFIVLVFMP